MSSTKELRQLLGFSQKQMANYLAVSRTYLAMAETNQRSLPTQSSLRWGLLWQSLQTNELIPSAKAAAASKERLQKNRKLLQKQLKACHWQLSQLQFQFTQMQEHYQQCNKALHAVAFLRNKPPHVVLSEIDSLGLNLLEQQTLVKLFTCDIDAQTLLNLNIKVLAFKVAELEKLVAGVI